MERIKKEELETSDECNKEQHEAKALVVAAQPDVNEPDESLLSSGTNDSTGNTIAS